jgi:hypothetical protein
MNAFMKNISKSMVLFVAIILTSSCDLNKLDNPSLLSASKVDMSLLLNGVQINFANFFYNISDAGMQVTRLTEMYGPVYNNWFIPSYYNTVWQVAYENIIVNTRTVSAQAPGKGWYIHSGIAKMIEAYTALTMADFFGDVPYSKASSPNDINPAADKDADIYDSVLALINDAVSDFNKDAPVPADLYYNGDIRKWITLANTLKLKISLNKRMVDASGSTATINALIAANDLIDAPDGSEDFIFRYSTNIANPDSRHPYFQGNYLIGAGTYQTNWLMWNMRYGKKNAGDYVIDPRIRYYFYRQSGTIDTSDPSLTNVLPCITYNKPARYLANPSWPFCIPKDSTGGNVGYWGRDYGDASGVGPDTKSRTNWGVYPIGGKFDDDSFTPVASSDGRQGAGIAPIMLASFVDFMKAEAALYLGTTGDPQTLLISATDKSIKNVMSFGASVANGPKIPTSIDVQNYENKVAALYASAADNDNKMEVIAKEYWIAGLGNGVEIYNMYRRTGGKPSDMQIALRDPGQFPNTMPYPLVYTAQNNTAPAKDFDHKVFWDVAANSKVN